MRKKGFSLVELLVVISVIAILLAVGAAAYITVQRKARDAKRRADIKAMQEGFEQYYADNGNSYGAGAGNSCTPMEQSSQFPGGFPTDPKPAPYQQYLRWCSTTAYCVCAAVELVDGNFHNPNCDEAGSGANGDGGWFCLENLQ